MFVINIGGGVMVGFEAKNLEAAVKAAAAVALKPCPCGAPRDAYVPFAGKTKDGREYAGFRCPCGKRTYINRSKTGHLFWSNWDQPKNPKNNGRPKHPGSETHEPPPERYDENGIPF